MATKKNGKIKIQEEREKRQQQLAQVEYMIAQGQKTLANNQAARLKLIGALEQLDELEGVKPVAPSNDGAPKEILEKKEG